MYLIYCIRSPNDCRKKIKLDTNCNSVCKDQSRLYYIFFSFSASGCPHANRNKSRSMEGSLSMGQAGLLKYGGLIKAGIPPAAVPYSTHSGAGFLLELKQGSKSPTRYCYR